METQKVIEERRSIRKFKNQKISKEIVENIIKYGTLAPSAKNRQNWYFSVLTNDIKDKVADLMIEYVNNTDETEERKKMGSPSSVKYSAEVIKQAPVLIIIFKEKNDDYIISDTLSIGACIENICLRATDLGLGSLWIRDIAYVSDSVAELLEHTDLELNCAISIGIADENPKQRPRKELVDIIEWH
ncbi:MAG: nitroreductase family protein [Clostridia bacterium]|nr:nitroreductase family protein [Clostridia bacterium]